MANAGRHGVLVKSAVVMERRSRPGHRGHRHRDGPSWIRPGARHRRRGHRPRRARHRSRRHRALPPARHVVIANLAIAAAFITALVIWDLADYLPLPLGVLGHEGSTVIVGFNGLRLLRPGAWRRALTTPASTR